MFTRHPDTMKTPCVSLLLGVCVLLLSAPTVSAVSLSVSPNLQQFFRGSSSVYLSCVDDGQTADGWTVKRTRGGRTEDCGAAGSEFMRINSSFCALGLSTGGNFLCVSSSGQQSDEVSISVSEGGVILEIPALPVMTGSDVTLYCTPKEGERRKSYFIRDNVTLGSGPEGKWNLSKVQRSDEGLYSCHTDIHPRSPQSRLRVRDLSPVDSPPTTTSPLLLTTFPPSSSSPHSSSSLLLYLLVLPVVLVLVLVGGVVLWRKQRGGRGADLWSCGGDGCLRRSVCLCCLFLLTAAGVCVLLLSALTVSAASPPPCESVLRLFCHLVVFCPYCISTGLLLSICCSRNTPNKPAVSMEMSQRDGGGQGLAEDGDDVTADVTTEHAF
ncbi:uncharacterized protein LOC116329876 [Oreochromis aureus]|uniref:uncharacterized protein LOC116329876 n=1 Tax=Oreochromis aureus TaxID=47969 RepID=UPI001952D31A|nr:uncharacterized protein LOC116329876 [Oreochromis aureus]